MWPCGVLGCVWVCVPCNHSQHYTVHRDATPTWVIVFSRFSECPHNSWFCRFLTFVCICVWPQVSGTGEASLAVSLAFVPSQLLTFPTYRGIWVEAAVQLVDTLGNTAVGPALSAVPLGSVVQVTVQVCVRGGGGGVLLYCLLFGWYCSCTP